MIMTGAHSRAMVMTMTEQLHFRSKILGVGAYLPKQTLTNQDLEARVETSHEWIMERTGIASRHIAAPEQATSDLAYEASIQALQEAKLTPQDLDAILVATATPDHSLPSTACLLQARLQCRSIMALDVSAACSGFIYALSVADQFIRNGMYRNVLVVGAETLSRITNPMDRQTCILFGDGAGAVIVSRTQTQDSSQILSSHLHANGEFGDLLIVPGGGSREPLTPETLAHQKQFVHMKGRDIFKAAVRTMRDRCVEALEANHLRADDVSWLLAHQANRRIIEAVAELLEFPMEKVLLNVEHTGNTSSASIPILLRESIDAGKIQHGDTLLLTAFGAGLTSASLLLKF